MSVLLYADESQWLQLPKQFPTRAGQSAEEWEDHVIEGMRETWHEPMTPLQETAARAGLRHGLTRVQNEDALTLQFWPMAAPINVVVHVVAGLLANAEVEPIPLLSGTYASVPVVESFSTESLGEGVEVRYLMPLGDPPVIVGGINYLFRGPEAFVSVVAEATVPTLTGLLLDPLREVVGSIEIVDDLEIGQWVRSTVDPSILPSRGEPWALSDAS